MLYSHILPLGLADGQEKIQDGFVKLVEQADRVEIAVGYVSQASLQELDRLLDERHLRHVVLILGMYFTEGMPERTYRLAKDLNQKWQEAGCGEIRIVRPFQYHGKVYCFFKDGKPFAAMMGSANLGFIRPDSTCQRQYEVAAIVEDASTCSEIAQHVKRLSAPVCSLNLAEVPNIPLVRELNVSLHGIDGVEQFPKSEFDLYAKHKTDISFTLPIKVPRSSERFLDDSRHYTKSNINVCYAAPRSQRKARDWFEVQMTVSKEIREAPGYPERNQVFFVITDDGYCFKAHTTSDNNKQFSAFGDELILGRWIKGQLEAAGLVPHINDTLADTNRVGMITQEMLDAFGRDCLVLTKTTSKMPDEDGVNLDVWLLSFEKSEDAEESEE